MRILDSIIIGLGVTICIIAILYFIVIVGSPYSDTIGLIGLAIMMVAPLILPIIAVITVGTTIYKRRNCN